MCTRNYGSMHEEIIRYVASTILIAMSVQGDPMTMIQIKGEVNYEDIHYVPEALEFLQERGLIRHHEEETGLRTLSMAYDDLYTVPDEVEEEVYRVCICAINDNINKIKQGGNTQRLRQLKIY